MLSLRTRAFALLTSLARDLLISVSFAVLASMVSVSLFDPSVMLGVSRSRPELPPPPPPLPPEPPELLWLLLSLDTMAAMATPRATAAAATTRPAGMPKRVEVRAALMAANIPSTAAPMVPIMPAKPA